MTAPRRPRILIVDDHTAVRDRLTNILTPTCEIVGTVGDGETALVAIDRLQLDVVVLDISLPGMSRLDVAGRLRQSGSTLPIVFLTSYEDHDLRRAAEAVGRSVFVTKAHSDDLLNAIASAVGGRP